ncbi:MAG: hypothetical protein GX247_00440 [Mollicutes bacterium]|nr:hypothetical protein [Mollicutes bacterium]
MKLIDRFRNYILEEEFTINIYPNKINIVNYTSINHFDNHKVVIRHKDGEVIINGNNLVVSRLLLDEILITGDVKNIELR